MSTFYVVARNILLGTLLFSQNMAQAQGCSATISGSGMVNLSTLSFTSTGGANCNVFVAGGNYTGSLTIAGLGTGRTLSFDKSVVITGNVLLTGNGNPSVQVAPGVTVRIKGNLDLPTNNQSLTVGAGGELIIDGGVLTQNGNGTTTIGGAGEIEAVNGGKLVFVGTGCAAGGCPTIVDPTVTNCSGTVCQNVTCANPVATPVITGSNLYCSGTGNLRLEASSTAGATYVWTVPVTATGISGTSTSTVSKTGVATTDAGTYSVRAYDDNCVSTASSVNVTVRSSPSAVTISGTTDYCVGDFLSLSATSSTFGVTYNWVLPTGSTATTLLNTVSKLGVTATEAGTYSVTATLNGCGSTSSKVVTVNAPPNTPTIAGQTVYCAGDNLRLEASSTTAGVSFTWTKPLLSSATITGAIVTKTGLNALDGGTYSVTATKLGCTSPAASVSVAVNTVVFPSVSIVSDAPSNTICSGKPVTFTATPTNGGPAPTYQWKLNGSSNVGTNSSSFTTSSLSNGNQISVVLTSSLSCRFNTPTSNTITTTVNTTPVTPLVNGAINYCIGGSLGLNASSSTGGVTYTWQLPASATGVTVTGGSVTKSAVALTDAGVYKVTATLGACTSTQVSTTVTVNNYNTWLGAASTDWATAANWACGRVPVITEDVRIAWSTNKPIVGTNTNAAVKKLSVDPSTSLALQGQAKLSVAGDWANGGLFIPNTGTVEFVGSTNQQVFKDTSFTSEKFYNLSINKTGGTLSLISNTLILPQGTLLLQAGTLDVVAGKTLTLKSAGSRTFKDSTARLGRVTGTITPTSVFTLERYIPSPETRLPYASIVRPAPTVLLAPALKDLTAAQWTDDIQAIFGANSSTIASYSELNGTGATLQDKVNRGWRYLASASVPVTLGAGYKVFVGLDNNNDLLKVTGIPHTGSFAKQITYTLAGTQGWNLVGNPYPCEIDWSAVYNLGANNTVVEPAVYILDPLNADTNNSSYYVYHATTGIVVDPRNTSPRTNANGRHIASSQGFFVKALKNGTLTFNEAVKPLAPFVTSYANFREEDGEVVRLTLSDDEATAQTVVHFKTGATNDYEPISDAELLSSGKLDVYTEVAGKPLVINGLSTLDEPVALVVRTERSGIKKWKVSEFSTTKTVYLFDKQKHVFTPLSEGATYTFDDSTDSLSKGRFWLVPQKDVVTGITNGTHLPEKAMLIHPNPYSGGHLQVYLPSYADETVRVELLDHNGSVIHAFAHTLKGSRLEIDLSTLELPKGVYTLRCAARQGVVQTSRLVIQ